MCSYDLSLIAWYLRAYHFVYLLCMALFVRMVKISLPGICEYIILCICRAWLYVFVWLKSYCLVSASISLCVLLCMALFVRMVKISLPGICVCITVLRYVRYNTV